MKKIIIGVVLVLMAVAGFAQAVDTTKYVNYRYSYGNRMPRYWADSLLTAGKFQLKSAGEYSTDFTLPKVGASVTLDTISADRTVTFPDLSLSERGVVSFIYNSNNSAFVWNVAGNVKEADGTVISNLPRGLHIFYWNSNAWIRLSTSGGSSPTVDTLTFTSPLTQLNKNVYLDYSQFPADTISFPIHGDSLYYATYYAARNGNPAYHDSVAVLGPASDTKTGLMTYGSQTFAGQKTWNDGNLFFGQNVYTSGSEMYMGNVNGIRWTELSYTSNRPTVTYGGSTFLRWNIDSLKYEVGNYSIGWKCIPFTDAVGGGGTWGSITGTLSSQTDLQTALNAKLPTTITTTGDLIYSSAGTTASRLGIGSTNQVLTVIGGLPSWQTPAAGGSGTVTSVATGYGINGGTITTTGTLTADTSNHLASKLRLYKVADSLGGAIALKGSGTITSVATGYGLLGGTVTTTGTLIADTNVVASRLRTTKITDSLGAAIGLKLTNPLTTTGDVIYSSSGSVAARLGIGTAGQVLTTTSGIPAWATPLSVSGFTTSLVTVATKNQSKIFAYTAADRFMGTQDSIWNGSVFTASSGTFLGFQAGLNNTGANIALMGHQSGLNNTGTQTTAMGFRSAQGNTGSSVTAVGYQAGLTNSGASATLFGHNAGSSNNAASVTFVGLSAGSSNTGSSSTGVGLSAMQSNTGTIATGVGANALQNNTATYVNGFGSQALQNNTGTFSDGFGGQALVNNVATSSVGFGYKSGSSNNWQFRTSLGFQAGNTFTGATTKTFASGDVSGTTITITAHGFGTVGQKVNLKYNLLTGTNVGTLTNGSIYQFTIATANTLTLSIISSAGAGTYSLEKDADKTYSIEIGPNALAEKSYQFITSTNITETRLFGALKIDSLSERRIVVEGDSFSDAIGDWYSYIGDSSAYLGKFSVKTYGLGGATTANMITDYTTQARLDAPLVRGNDSWFMLYGGVNDIGTTGVAATTTYANLKTLWALARADRYKVAGITIFKSNIWTAGQNAMRDSLNTLIKSDQSLYDILIDWDAGIDFSVNTSYTSDGLHPSASGARAMASLMDQTFNERPFALSKTTKDSLVTHKWNMHLNPTGNVLAGGTLLDKALVTTTNATPTTVHTIIIPDETAGVLEITIVGREATTAGAITGKKIVRYVKNGGTLTLGTPTAVLADEATGTISTATWTVTTSSNNVIVQGTGVAATTINWESAIQQTSN